MVLAFACALGQHQAECSAVFEWDLYGVWRIKVDVNGDPGVLVLDTGSNQTVVSSNLILKQLSLRGPDFPRGARTRRYLEDPELGS